MTEFKAPQLRMVATDRPEFSRLSTPAWYRRKCKAQVRAILRDQMTRAEAKSDLDFWHAVMMRTEAM